MVYNIIMWSGTLLFHLMHPFHVSVTEISFNDNNKHLEINIRIFTDDLEDVLEQYGNADPDLFNSFKEPMVQALLKSYLESNFVIKENDKKLDLDFVGAEEDGDVIWCYMESKRVRNPESIWVRNSLLLDLFDDQINLVHLIIGKNTRSTKYFQDNYSGPVISKKK